MKAGLPAARAALGLAGLLALAACAGPGPGGADGGGEPAASGGDSPSEVVSPSVPSAAQPSAADIEELRALDADIQTRNRTTDAQLAQLRALWERYPGEPRVLSVLTTALVQRKDWGGLVDVVETLEAPSQAQRLLAAKAMLKMGRFADAEAVLLPLHRAAPEDAELAYNAAFALFHLGRKDDAAAVLDRGWEGILAADDVNGMALRALSALDLGAPERAIEIAEEAVARRPDYFPAWNVLGRARATLGDEAGARAALDRVDEIHAATSRDTARRLRLSAQATALQEAWDAGRLDEAEALVEAMLPEAPDEVRVELLGFAAAIYDATGRVAEAEQARDDARDLQLDAGAP